MQNQRLLADLELSYKIHSKIKTNKRNVRVQLHLKLGFKKKLTHLFCYALNISSFKVKKVKIYI